MRNSEVDILYQAVVCVSSIDCTRCGAIDTTLADDYDAAKIFHQRGWAATELHVYCPECARKYLKSKEKVK